LSVLISPANNTLAPFQNRNAKASEMLSQTNTLTIYGDINDGEVLNRWCTSDWNTCRNAATGNERWEGLTVGTVGATYDSKGYTIQRVFFYFDTSSIPSNAQITSVTLNVYAGQYQNGNKTIHVVRSSAGLPLTTADFSKIEYVSGGSVTPSSINSWMGISLNATGLNWIVKGGMTKLALIHTLDLNNTMPTVANDVLVGLTEDTQHRPYIKISYSTASPIVDEARLDIGMPYPTKKEGYHRGCPSDYTGCNGPYHGFYKGVCTDLVLDSYNAGALFNIQNALYQDYRINRGRYQWGSSRNAEDMRRYFIYNQDYLSNSQPYQPGDIAFFDWNGDGLTNHVLIISEVDANNRPLKMVDASDVIPDINLSGLAFEHNWSNYYEQHIQGHARLSSHMFSSTAPITETLQELRVTVDSPSVGLSVFDSNGKSTSEVFDENLVASNIEDFIPYIPGGSYASLGSQTVITVSQPLSNTNQYYVRVDGRANTTYTLSIQTLQDNSITVSKTFTQAIGIGETQNTGITITAPSGVISFTAQSPMLSPGVDLPSLLSLNGLVGTSAQITFTISETSGQQPFNNASITTTDLLTQYGTKILSNQLNITPNNFSVIPGGSRQVNVQVDLANLNPGEYLGSLLFTSQNENPMMIPITLRVQPHTLYLPSIIRN
jgi:hypothetical protein